jgi:hypothetical protein
MVALFPIFNGFVALAGSKVHQGGPSHSTAITMRVRSSLSGTSMGEL